MYHKSIGNTKIIKLDTTAAQATSSDYSAAAVNSSAFFVSTSLIYVGELGADYVSYCFAPIKGYSKFGSYVGNGANNGPFVHCGFKPAFILIKNIDATQVWIMYDGARKPVNRDDNVASIYASEVSAEYTGASYHNLDILSNGFKIRLTDPSQNGSGVDYVYMAFAENPFVTSTGVPATAR